MSDAFGLAEQRKPMPPNASRVIDPDLIKPGIGPIVTAYLQKAGSFSDLEPEKLVERILYQDTLLPTAALGWNNNARFIPGSTFSGKCGPGQRRRVMILGKIASYEHVQLVEDEEESEGKGMGLIEQQTTPMIDMLLGQGKGILLGAFKEAGISPEEYADFYVTNLVRFPRLDDGRKRQIPASWIKECAHFLQQEIHLIQPDIILCMGSEPSKYITKVVVTKAQGRVFEIPVTETHTAKVVCILDPKAVLEKFENRPMLMAGVNLFARVLRGTESSNSNVRNFFFVDNEAELSLVVDALIDAKHTEFTVDCEWGGGQHCKDLQAKLRTVQIGWSGRDALVVILNRVGMKEAFNPYISSAFACLRKLLCRPEVRVIGHNLAADFGWLHEYGLDLSSQFYFDTMLASHLFEPTASHDLDSLAVKNIVGWQRHDAELQNWVAENKDLVPKGMGYGNIPDEILHPYGANDVCATYLVFKYYEAKLGMQQHMGLNKLFRDLVMPATLAFIEIERTGVCMDRDRLLWMEDRYREKYVELLENFRNLIGKPWFNPNSAKQKVNLLYGELGLEPVKTTGKYPKMWDEVVSEGKQHLFEPAVDDETLGTLAGLSPIAKGLQDLCLISTVRKSFLTPKVLNKKTGRVDFKKGLIGFLKSDGRLHPYISQMVKTGRLASHDPNLMNMPNQQEAAIKLAAGGGLPGIRSCFLSEVGYLMVCADYSQAEIATLAYLSGDPVLIASVETGQDIHSVVAKEMFKLTCTVKEVKKLFKHLRVSAKAIIFGLIYGRGAKAISREVEKAGVPCSQEDAQGFIDAFFAKFPLVKLFIEKTQKQMEEQLFVETLWGRREMFYKVEGDKGDILARQKRQAVNFLVQSYVADLLRLALINLQNYRREHDMHYRLILTVHDSIMLETPIPEVEEVALNVMPYCMTEAARAPRLGFKVGSDVDVCQRWDEKMYLDEMVELGLTKDFALKFCVKGDDGQPKSRSAA